MIDFSGNFVRVNVYFGGEIPLPFGGEFSEVVPEPDEVTPLVGGISIRSRLEHFCSELGGPVGDFVEVAVVGLESSTFFAGFALALLFSVAEGSEERFPFFRIIREGWMGVGVGRMGHG